MPFKDYERVVYKQNTIEEVVCQIRFPAIYKIEKDPPAEFQEAIKERFSEVEKLKRTEHLFEMKEGEVPNLVVDDHKIYIFKSPDSHWRVTLDKGSLALTTSKYTRWEDFRGKAQEVFTVFFKMYQPKSISRIGLRYINVVQKKKLALEKADWKDLISPSLLGCFADGGLPKESIKNYVGQFTIELTDGMGLLNANFGLVQNAETGETGFQIDGDFFTPKPIKFTGDVGDVFTILEHYQNRARRFFRWSITEQLHQALGPERVS